MKVDGIVLLHCKRYKRLPFFRKADDKTFLPKYLLVLDFSNTNTQLKLQREYCTFMKKYYHKLKDNFEFIANTPYDEISFALFKRNYKYNLFGKILSSIMYKFCHEFDGEYTFLDMHYIMMRSGHYFFVNNELTIIPTDFLEMASNTLLSNYKNINETNLSKREFIQYIQDLHDDIFRDKNVRVLYPSSIQLIPLLSYALMITVFNNEISSILLKPIETNSKTYKLKIIKIWTSTVETKNKFENPLLWHFNTNGLITPTGEKVKHGELIIKKGHIITNKEKIETPIYSPIDNITIYW